MRVCSSHCTFVLCVNLSVCGLHLSECEATGLALCVATNCYADRQARLRRAELCFFGTLVPALI